MLQVVPTHPIYGCQHHNCLSWHAGKLTLQELATKGIPSLPALHREAPKIFTESTVYYNPPDAVVDETSQYRHELTEFRQHLERLDLAAKALTRCNSPCVHGKDLLIHVSCCERWHCVVSCCSCCMAGLPVTKSLYSACTWSAQVCKVVLELDFPITLAKLYLVGMSMYNVSGSTAACSWCPHSAM